MCACMSPGQPARGGVRLKAKMHEKYNQNQVMTSLRRGGEKSHFVYCEVESTLTFRRSQNRKLPLTPTKSGRYEIEKKFLA